MTKFTPKLGHDPAYMKDPDPRSEPYEFALTNAERDIAVNARLEIIAMQREQSRFVPGLVAKRVDESELSEAERAAFGFVL